MMPDNSRIKSYNDFLYQLPTSPRTILLYPQVDLPSSDPTHYFFHVARRGGSRYVHVITTYFAFLKAIFQPLAGGRRPCRSAVYMEELRSHQKSTKPGELEWGQSRTSNTVTQKIGGLPMDGRRPLWSWDTYSRYLPTTFPGVQ